MSTPLRFPMFFDLTGRRVVVAGCGNIALRRIRVLLDFGADVTVVAPEAKELPEGIHWISRGYETGDLAGAFLAVAATNSREVNHLIGVDAGKAGIPVSVADCREECTFFFPAICKTDSLVAGVVSDGFDHSKTARAARAIRSVMEELP